MESEKGPVSQPSQDSSEEQQHYEVPVDSVEPLVLLAPDAGWYTVYVLYPLSAVWITKCICGIFLNCYGVLYSDIVMEEFFLVLLLS